METSISIRNLDLRFGALEVLSDLNLDVGKGEVLVLLGASGCGKSTLLNCIAGLLDASGGQIFIGGRNVTWEEPSNRGIGMVFQSYALYPQMTVEGNLSFGLRNAGASRQEIARRVARAAKILQIEPLLKRRPAALSGGQRQRVAIGRALVRDVEVFLFDEPLSNLDAKLRVQMRIELKRLQRDLGTTSVYVTHDQVEAMTLADRIAVMRGGAILQLGSPREIYDRPASKYVAEFVGSPTMNFLDGLLDISGAPRLRSDALEFAIAGYGFGDKGPRGGEVWFGIRPEHVVAGDAAGAAPVRSEAGVELVEPLGSDTLVRANLNGAPIWFRMDGQAAVGIGEILPIGFDPARASIFDKHTEARL